jgi:predicted PurR-regulated permease PerM
MSTPNSQPATADGPLERGAGIVLPLAVSLALVYILLPFYGAIMWAAILALLFAPLQRWMLQRLAGRANTSAMLTLLIVLLMVVLPLLMVGAKLVQQASMLYQRLHSGELDPKLYFHGLFDALPGWFTAVLDRFGLVSFDTLQSRLTASLTQASQFIASQTFNLGQNTFEWVASVFITLYLAFFFIRDGKLLAQTLWQAIPLETPHKQFLRSQFITVIRATVRGSLLIAAIQGALGGLAFWYLGVSAALLWAVLMACSSLLPAVGAALVWGPVASYFLLSGETWKGLALVAYGMLVMGLIDNLLRPMLVGKETRLPDYFVMITTLGGMAAFGINGLVLGPVIGAMTIAVWRIRLAGLDRAQGVAPSTDVRDP